MSKAREEAVGKDGKIGRRRKNGANGTRQRAGNDSRIGQFKRSAELEAAIQRFSDLYEFAPVGYITFDRTGRIKQINLAAAELIGIRRESLIGAPFTLYVAREDMSLLLNHLVRCRSGERRVETNIHLKKQTGALTSVFLCSTPTSLLEEGAQLFQTAIVDVTERERAEEALRAKEVELEQIVTQTPFMLVRCTRDLRFRYVSHAYAKMVGLTSEEIAGKPLVEILGKQGLKIIQPNVERVLRGETVSYEALVPFKNRGPRFLHGVYVPDKDPSGEVVGWIASMVDVTERKEVEAAAMRLAAVVQSSHDAVVAKTLEGIITDWNQSAERIFGYTAKEIVGKSILVLIPTDRHPEEAEILRKISRGQSIDHYETVRRRKDGSLINVALTISPIRDPKGKIVGVSKIARDITRQKQADQRLAEQAHLLDLTNEAIMVRDRRDRITYWNSGAEELYRFSEAEAMGRVTHELLRSEHSEPLKEIYQKLERTGRWRGEIVHRRKDGKKICVMSHWALDRDESGKPAFILETNTDITSRKQAELVLRRSKKMLEQLVDQRTRALRNANTELETEIARRKGMEGQILEISDREQERLGRELHDGLCQQLTAIAFMARAAALRLNEHRVADPAEMEKIAVLINNSVTDARNIAHDLHKEQVDAASLEHSLRDMAERKIWKTPCRFQIEGNIEIEDDRVAYEIFRILREGVINANKHARATQIVLQACRRKRELIFSVTDNGVGLNGNKDSSPGLGFHIMHYRAQSIGARLELESPRGGGTRVALYLPISR